MCPEPTFPCTPHSTDSQLKLSGVYAQRQKGLWMQRIKIQGGVLEAEDWQTLAGLARTYTPGTPLLITTRQCIEFHNINSKRICLRCSKSWLRPDLPAWAPAATPCATSRCVPATACALTALTSAPQLRRPGRYLKSFEGVYSLPRKFKISFSGCERFCAQPYINDLGFTAQVRGNDDNRQAHRGRITWREA